MPRMSLTEPPLIAAAQARREPGPYSDFVANVGRIEQKRPKSDASKTKSLISDWSGTAAEQNKANHV